MPNKKYTILRMVKPNDQTQKNDRRRDYYQSI
jgi:hypothetical protein